LAVTVAEIVRQLGEALGLEMVTPSGGGPKLDRQVTGGYASDLLSCVMAHAEAGNVWVTLQAHTNVVAVADLKELACVIITEGARPDEETLARAEERGVPILLTTQGTFPTVAALSRLGVL
jgi:predicted transcriptional regulator